MDNYLNRWGLKFLSVWEAMTEEVIKLGLTKVPTSRPHRKHITTTLD